MIRDFRDLGLVWPTLFLVVVFGGLITLGTWQLQRKEFKDAIVAEIALRGASAPVVFSGADSIKRWLDEDGGEYSPVRLRGVFEHDKERFYYAPHQKFGPGYHVYTPLRISDDRVVWINRGFVSEQFKARDKRGSGGVEGEVEVSGLVRMPGSKGRFAAENDVAKNIWYWRDLDGMHRSAFASGGVKAFPMFVEALAAPENLGGWPKGGVTRVEISNRHLEYAVTWFGLSLTLLGVYAAFVWGRIRARSRKDTSAG